MYMGDSRLSTNCFLQTDCNWCNLHCVSCISLQDNFSKLLSVILQLSFQQPQACNCNPCCRHNLDFCGYGVFAVRLQLSLIACPEAVCLTPRFLTVSPLVSFILFEVSASFTTSSSKSWCWSDLEFRFFADAFKLSCAKFKRKWWEEGKYLPLWILRHYETNPGT